MSAAVPCFHAGMIKEHFGQFSAEACLTIFPRYFKDYVKVI